VAGSWKVGSSIADAFMGAKETEYQGQTPG